MNRMERAENQINVQAYVRNLMFQLRHRKVNSQLIKNIFQRPREWCQTRNHRLYQSIGSRLFHFGTAQFNPEGLSTLT